jgi:hypothetical protein
MTVILTPTCVVAIREGTETEHIYLILQMDIAIASIDILNRAPLTDGIIFRSMNGEQAFPLTTKKSLRIRKVRNITVTEIVTTIDELVILTV